MLYRKLEVAHSPEKHQLREDYFRLLDHWYIFEIFKLIIPKTKIVLK